MRKIMLGITTTTIAFVALGAGLWYWLAIGRYTESTDDAYVRSDISVISPKVAGYVDDVRVTDNQYVHAGDVLATIDDADFAARVDKAQAGLQAQRAALASLDSKRALQQALIGQARAMVHSAEADLAHARNDYRRYKSLSAQHYVSGQRVDLARTDLRKGEARLANSRAALQAAQRELAVIDAARKQAAAALAQQRAALNLAQLDLEHTVIRAPVDGVVGNRAVQNGEFVQPGRQLMVVVPLPSVYVIANFKETQLAGMRVGQPVEIEVDAFPDHTLRGRIESFAPASGSEFSLLPPQNATGNFTKIVQRVPVRIAVPKDNPLAGRLRPGLSVVVSIDTRAAAHGPALVDGVFGTARPALAVSARP